MGLIAGVDSSTQSTKVVLYDADEGRPVGAGSSPHPQTYPPVSEQDPGAWWEALGHAMRSAADAAGVSLGEVRAISVAAQCHGLVPLDRAGRVLRPAKLWNDTTSSPQMSALLEEVSAPEWIDRVGSVPTAAFTVSKLLWLREHEPDAFRDLASILLPHDWLTFMLTGERITDRSDASGTGYFDATRDEYDLGILSLIDPGRDWAGMLPRVLGPSTPAGTLTAGAAAWLGLRQGIVVGPGAGDQHASALGLGVAPGDVAYSFGTSGVVFSTSIEPVRDPSGIVNGVADAAGGYLPLVCTLNAARVTDAFARWLGVDHAQLSALALDAAPSSGPVLAAYLDGERMPDLPGATGTLAGLTTGTSREEVARAAVEGVVFGLYRGEQALRASGVRLTGRVIATGGASRSPAYPQLLADITGSDVHVSDAVESVAAGAAIQAAACLTGADIATVRDAWAADARLAATPRADTEASARFARYLDVAERNAP